MSQREPTQLIYCQICQPREKRIQVLNQIFNSMIHVEIQARGFNEDKKCGSVKNQDDV